MRLRSISAALLTSLLAVAATVLTAGTASASGPSMSISFSSTSASYGGTVTVTAALGSATHDRTLAIYVDTPGSSHKLVRQGTVNSSGKLVASVQMYKNATFSAEFAGDDVYDARTVSRALPVHARLVMASSSTSRSGSYHLFKAGSQPQVNMRVDSPNPGGCVTAVGQQYYSRAWHTFGSSSCLTLDSTSHTGVRITGSPSAGTRLRVVAYSRSSTINAYSPHTYYYMLFTR